MTNLSPYAVGTDDHCTMDQLVNGKCSCCCAEALGFSTRDMASTGSVEGSAGGSDGSGGGGSGSAAGSGDGGGGSGSDTGTGTSTALCSCSGCGCCMADSMRELLHIMHKGRAVLAQVHLDLGGDLANLSKLLKLAEEFCPLCASLLSDWGLIFHVIDLTATGPCTLK